MDTVANKAKIDVSTEGYRTAPGEYSQYCLNASLAGERVMSFAEWLKEYRRVCSEDVVMLVKENK